MSDRRGLSHEHEEALARYRAGVMSAAERASFEGEALADDTLSEALYTELSLDQIHASAGAADALDLRAKGGEQPLPAARVTPLAPARSGSRWRGARVLVPLAASVLAVSLLVLWQARTRQATPGGDWVRGEDAITALEPAGELGAAPEWFRWTRDPGAANYRVELFDANGNNWGTAVSPDTVLAFGAVARRPLAEGHWRVVAIGPDGLDRSARSRASFRVVPR